MDHQIPNLGVVSSNLAGHANTLSVSLFFILYRNIVVIEFISVFTILIIMKIFLILFVLLCSSSALAEDISDFEIEGISVGDSLLDYFTIDEINKVNKYYYIVFYKLVFS